MEAKAKARIDASLGRFPKAYWKYLLATALFGLGNSSNAFLILQTQDIGASLTATILIYAGFNLVAALISYPAGFLSDRLGRRNIIVLALVIFLIVYAGFASSRNIAVIAVLFAFYGLHQGIFRSCRQSLASAYVPERLRASGIGWYNATVGLCGLVASLAAGWLWDEVGHTSVFLFARGSLRGRRRCNAGAGSGGREDESIMISARTRALLIAATVLSGLLAGGNVDRAIVAMPAWEKVGASGWATFSRHADLGNGLVLKIPLEAIGAFLLIVLTAVSLYRDGAARVRIMLPLSSAAVLAAAGLLCTLKAAPIMLSVGHLDDPASLQQAFDGFRLSGRHSRRGSSAGFFLNDLGALRRLRLPHRSAGTTDH